MALSCSETSSTCLRSSSRSPLERVRQRRQRRAWRQRRPGQSRVGLAIPDARGLLVELPVQVGGSLSCRVPGRVELPERVEEGGPLLRLDPGALQRPQPLRGRVGAEAAQRDLQAHREKEGRHLDLTLVAPVGDLERLLVQPIRLLDPALLDAEFGQLVQPAAEEVGGVELSGKGDRPREQPLGLLVVALGSRGGGQVRHLVGDVGPVPELDSDPEGVDEAGGCPGVIALLPVHLTHVADVDADGLSLAHLLGHCEGLAGVAYRLEVVAPHQVHQTEVAGRIQQAAPVSGRNRHVERPLQQRQRLGGLASVQPHQAGVVERTTHPGEVAGLGRHRDVAPGHDERLVI